MATSVVEIGTPSGLTKFRETDLGGTKAAVKASSGTIHSIVADNSANAAVSYLKLWDVASGDVTVGTTAPDWIFKLPASTKRTIIFNEGGAFATALTAACVTAGGTAGTTNPTSDFAVEILFV